MTAPDPQQVIAAALQQRVVTAPNDDAKTAIDALAAAGYAIVRLPTEPATVDQGLGNVGITRASIGRATARVRADTGELRNIITETFLFTDTQDAAAFAGEILAVAAWVDSWKDGSR
jgi:hypothetical protein